MGQYHIIYNITKKEYFRIGGAKLWEQSHPATAMAFLLLLSNSNGRGGGDFLVEDHNKNILEIVEGRWIGDQIVVQGDYVEETDKGSIPETEFETYTDISQKIADALLLISGDGGEAMKIIEKEMALGFGSLKNHAQESRVAKRGEHYEQISNAERFINACPDKKKRKTKKS